MPALAELQAEMASALLNDPAGLSASLFAAGPVPIIAALRAHRDTVLGALVRALRLTFPTVDRLVGEACFDQAASAFAAAHQPRGARLDLYGEGFAEFLERHPPTRGLAYLGDVARLDLAIDRAALTALAERAFPLDEAVALSLPRSLMALELSCPAQAIRDALETDDDGALGAIDLTPRLNWLAIWRTGPGVVVKPLSPPAGVFLSSLLAGADADLALNAAIAADPHGDVLAILRAEVFAAAFSSVLTLPPSGAFS